MWIEELKNGKYRAVERYTDPMTGKQKKISVTIERDTRAARKEAQRILDQKIEKAIGESGRPEALTMKKLTELYLQHQKEAVKASTYQKCIPGMNKLCRVIGEDVLVNRLTAGYCMSKIQEVTSTASTINTYIGRIKQIMTWAYSVDLIDSRTWLDKLQKVKDNRKDRIEDKYLEPDELQAVIDGLRNEKHKAMTKFLALTGCRIGEALALTMSDLDGEYIHITKTMDVITRLVMDTPKTAESTRDIYIQPELKTFLSRYRKDRLYWQLQSGHKSDLLFSSSNGTALDYTNYLRALKKASAAIGHEITPHALRHTHASVLAAQGMSYDAIARRLGHAGEGVTKQVYMHVTSKLREMDNARMDSVRIL